MKHRPTPLLIAASLSWPAAPSHAVDLKAVARATAASEAGMRAPKRFATQAAPGIVQRAPHATGTGPTRRGIAPDGRPYVEETRPDGTIVRTYSTSVDITSPGGRRTSHPIPSMRMSTQGGNAPELPPDRSNSPTWLDGYNGALLDVIAAFVHRDAAALRAMTEEEKKVAGADVPGQISYRTDIVRFFVTHGGAP